MRALLVSSTLVFVFLANPVRADIVLGNALGPTHNSPISLLDNDFDDPRVCFEVLSGSEFEGLAEVFLEVGINEPGTNEQISFDVTIEVFDADPNSGGLLVDTSGAVAFPDFNLNGPTSGQTNYIIPTDLGSAKPLVAGHYICGTVTTTLNGGPGENPDRWGIAPSNAAVPEPSSFLFLGLVVIACGTKKYSLSKNSADVSH